MNSTLQQKKNYKYIDLIKLIACLLVIFYHFSSSLLAANLIPKSSFYLFFIQTVNTFHVPLFFACSGFLYQHSNRVHDLKSWKKNICHKFVDLGIPYFTFSSITFFLKTIFESNVNTPISGYFSTLFLNPTAPYWYLYTLFFIFLFVPCFKNKNSLLLFLVLSCCLKALNIIFFTNNINLPYIITSVTSNLIWFAFGMVFFIYAEELNKMKIAPLSVCLFIVALIISAIFYRYEIPSQSLKLGIGIMYVIAVFLGTLSHDDRISNYISKIKEYIMPIYLMHTIFAAGLRILLLKFGITNIFVHILLGIIGSLIIPAVVYRIAKSTKIFLIFFYPTKTIKNFKG